MYNRKDGMKYIKRRLRELKKQGYTEEQILQGKTVEHYAHNRKTFDKFKHRIKKEKEMKSIGKEREKEREVKELYNRAIKGEDITDSKRGLLKKFAKKLDSLLNKNIKSIQSKLDKRVIEEIKINKRREKKTVGVQAFFKFTLQEEYSKSKAYKETQEKADIFLGNYFKNALEYANDFEKLEQMKKAFGARYDLLHEFMDEVTSIQFNYEHEGLTYEKGEYKLDYEDEYYDDMYNRFLMFENLLVHKYRLLNKYDYSTKE